MLWPESEAHMCLDSSCVKEKNHNIPDKPKQRLKDILVTLTSIKN